jgi:hypothetical protein
MNLFQKILAGIPRSGKSSLCKKIIANNSMTYIPFDSIVSTLGNLYPDLKISHHLDFDRMSKVIAPFLKEFIKHLRYEKVNFLIDIYQLYPKDFHHCGIDVEIYYIGYPRISIEQKVKDIKKFAESNDWSEQLTNSELEELVGRFIKESKDLETQCNSYNDCFIDLSIDFEKSFTNALELISG